MRQFLRQKVDCADPPTPAFSLHYAVDRDDAVSNPVSRLTGGRCRSRSVLYADSARQTDAYGMFMA